MYSVLTLLSEVVYPRIPGAQENRLNDLLGEIAKRNMYIKRNFQTDTHRHRHRQTQTDTDTHTNHQQVQKGREPN